MPFHSSQTLAARAAQDAQKEQLDLIVGMMRQSNNADAALFCSADKKFMAQLSRGHLDGQPGFLSKLPDVCVPDDNGQFQRHGRLANELLVGVAAAPPQLVVEMCNGQFPPVPRRKRMKDMQQRLRIQSAGDRNQDCLTTFEQLAVLNVLPDVLKQISHAVMLLHSKNGARTRNGRDGLPDHLEKIPPFPGCFSEATREKMVKFQGSQRMR
jgi:hypothetical protein